MQADLLTGSTEACHSNDQGNTCCLFSRVCLNECDVRGGFFIPDSEKHQAFQAEANANRLILHLLCNLTNQKVPWERREQINMSAVQA